MTLYEVPLNTFHGLELSKRYCECLENDPDNQARGMKSARTFLISWEQEMSEYTYGGAKRPPSLEGIARKYVTGHEIADVICPDYPLPEQSEGHIIMSGPNPPHHKNYKERRKESRAHLQIDHKAEPPPAWVAVADSYRHHPNPIGEGGMHLNRD